jgi:ribonuclease HII
MAWILGIDEAGYGPNLGPFVMSAVACRVPDHGADLWRLLRGAARRAGDGRDDRLVVDDSKEVYSASSGLAGLERGVCAITDVPSTLAGLVERLAPAHRDELAAEAWFTGATMLPTGEGHQPARERFADTCAEAGVSAWHVASVVVCPAAFNALIDRHDSKGAVLGHGFIRLFADALGRTAGDEPLAVFVDKQGGRNTYAAQVQQALTSGLVVPLEEGAARSTYRVAGLDREVRLTFQPRADQSFFCVALASMVSKYLRELFMGEFNAFWCGQVPGLKPTAGYPGDAARFFAAIRDMAKALGICEEAIWRKR